MMSALWVVVMMIGVTPWGSTHCLEVKQEKRLLVAMTLVPDAVCLDGSPPAYHLHGGLGSGARNWLLQFEVKVNNTDFYDWNRVKLRYCDGASFGGDSEFLNSVIHLDSAPLSHAISLLCPYAIVLGDPVRCSAGGLATFLHCDDLTRFVPETATVKCISDAGFFLDV
ncbi:hypothetical protein GW17_00014425 [Ensete ventricosum]|nr:hypothetical protein GW17_00014425 [Ensete ventricosum]